MNILVCIKQVPSRESTLRLREDALGVREDDLSFEINEPDTFALEEAVRELRAAGLEPAAVVATTGTTDFGAIDPVGAMASRPSISKIAAPA